MCTNLRYITNRYTHKRVLVSCGKCQSCLQEKADARAFRIRSSQGDGTVALFVTLTYSNDNVPVIRKSEVKVKKYINIYRGVGCNKVLDTIYLSTLPPTLDWHKLPSVRGCGDKDLTTVCYFPDIQRFFKRLRQNLKRNYHETRKFKYYACTEYGSTYKRAHCHLCITIPQDAIQTFRSAIVKSWTLCDMRCNPRYIQIARDVASYVASYVNSDSSIPPLFSKIRGFRQKHSYSEKYGISVNQFRLFSLLEKVNSGTLDYTFVNGGTTPFVTSVPIPKYVISRYFPIFKGYSRISPNEVRYVLQRPYCLACPLYRAIKGNEVIPTYRLDDLHKIFVSLKNHAEIYINAFKRIGVDKNYFDYCIDFERVWRCYKSTQMKYFYKSQVDDKVNDVCSFYDNIEDIESGAVHPDMSVFENYKNYLNYNRLPQRVKKTEDNKLRYSRMFKRKKVVNYVMTSQGHQC